MYRTIVWDLDDDPEGNVQHIAEHGLTREDVEHVFEHPVDFDLSRSSGYLVVFGDTADGRRVMVVFEEIDDESAYPIKAFEVPGGGA